MLRRSREFALIALAALAFSIAPTSGARAAAPDDREAAAAKAEQRAALMHAYDQAAWHATDAFLQDAGEPAQLAKRFPGIAGYIVLPSEAPGVLETIFFSEGEKGRATVARFLVEGSRVTSREVFDNRPGPPVSALANRMIDARGKLIEEVERRQSSACNSNSPNTLVLPPDEQGTIDAYLLASTTADDSYPLGGHYRVRIAADGTVADFRPFMNTCFEANWAKRKGQTPQMLIVTHLLDEQPTEIHAFASYHVPVPIIVVFRNSMWQVARGRISGPLRGEDGRPMRLTDP